MSDFKIIFVHGYTASSKVDWYPAISPLLRAAGIDFVVPDLPGGEYPHAGEWLSIIDREVRSAGKPVVLVGHSLGTRAVLLYLENTDVEVEKVILIAALSNDPVNGLRQDEHYPDFFTNKIDIQKVKVKSRNGFVVLHSRDDSDVPFAQGEQVARELDAKLIPAEGHDHFYQPQDAESIFKVIQENISLPD